MVTWDDELGDKATPITADEIPIIDTETTVATTGREKKITIESVATTNDLMSYSGAGATAQTWDAKLSTKTSPVFEDLIPILDIDVSTGTTSREKLATLDTLPYTITWTGNNLQNAASNTRFYTPGTNNNTTTELDEFEIIVPNDGKLVRMCAFSRQVLDGYTAKVSINQVQSEVAKIEVGFEVTGFVSNDFSVDVSAGDRLLIAVQGDTSIYSDIPVTLVGKFES